MKQLLKAVWLKESEDAGKYNRIFSKNLNAHMTKPTKSNLVFYRVVIGILINMVNAKWSFFLTNLTLMIISLKHLIPQSTVTPISSPYFRLFDYFIKARSAVPFCVQRSRSALRTQTFSDQPSFSLNRFTLQLRVVLSNIIRMVCVKPRTMFLSAFKNSKDCFTRTLNTSARSFQRVFSANHTYVLFEPFNLRQCHSMTLSILTITLSTILSHNVHAATVSLTTTWTTGQVLTAAALNTNFTDLTSQINGNLDQTNFAASITFSDSDLVSLASVNMSSTTEGLILGQAASCASATAEGQLCWDTDDDVFYGGSGSAAGGFAKLTSPVFTTSISIGSAGVRLSDDGDGALTFLGLGDGNDEDLTLNLDDTSNTAVVTSSTGLSSLQLSAIDFSVIGTGPDATLTPTSGVAAGMHAELHSSTNTDFFIKNGSRFVLEEWPGGLILGGSTAGASTTYVDVKTTTTGSSAFRVASGAIDGTEVLDDTLTASDLAADSVGSSEIAADAVGSSEIAADAVGASEIAADAVGTSEIAANAVDASELVATAVSAGTYGSATQAPQITIDADGRITSASNQTISAGLTLTWIADSTLQLNLSSQGNVGFTDLDLTAATSATTTFVVIQMAVANSTAGEYAQFLVRKNGDTPTVVPQCSHSDNDGASGVAIRCNLTMAVDADQILEYSIVTESSSTVTATLSVLGYWQPS